MKRTGKTQLAPPAPESAPDLLGYLEDDEAWLWIDDMGGGYNEAANILSAIITAIEAGQTQRAIDSLRTGLCHCFPFTEEFDLSLRLWLLNLFKTLPFEDEPKILLKRALERGMKRNMEGEK